MVDAAMEVTGICPIKDYVRRRQETILEYVAGSLIYGMCTGAERMEGYIMFLRGWEQEHGPTQVEREVGLKRNSV